MNRSDRTLGSILAICVAVSTLLALAGCEAAVLPEDEGEVLPQRRQFVLNSIGWPVSAAEVSVCALDLDGDSDTENKFGSAMVSFRTGYGMDAGEAMTASLADGALLQLFDLGAVSLDQNGTVSTTVFVGLDGDVPAFPGDNFSGEETFLISAATSGSTPLAGSITNGAFSAGPGEIPFLFTASTASDPVLLQLVGARITATASGAGLIDVRIGGAVRSSQVTDILIPHLHAAASAIVARDCPGGIPTPGSAGEALLNAMDDDKDGVITLTEFTNAPIVASGLSPDLDLLDENGDFAPNMDGVSESLSLGFRCTLVKARFDLP